MKKYKWLQLFAEGEAEGASASADVAPTETTATGEADSSNAQMDSLMSRIPERGKKAFKEAYEQTHPTNAPVEETKTEPSHVPYADLIKSEEYKAEHKAWADKAFSERFKAKDNEIQGLRQNNAKMGEVLSRLAMMYELDPTKENYIDALSEKISADDHFYEQYGIDHDMNRAEAKRFLEQEQRIKKAEAAERQRQADEQNRQMTQALLFHADQTRKQFPEFDLDKEWANEEFRRQCFNNGMDTTVAYQIIHMDEILHRNTAQAANQTKVAIANSIASGQNRPMESGLSNSPAAQIRTTPNFDGMNARQMREYAEKNLRRR